MRAARGRLSITVTCLDGKVVLVTGATDGLGRALVAELAREGATVEKKKK
jgi:NADP-dependent 3-hydroxy acid dehydrogenase YdfG